MNSLGTRVGISRGIIVASFFLPDITTYKYGTPIGNICTVLYCNRTAIWSVGTSKAFYFRLRIAQRFIRGTIARIVCVRCIRVRTIRAVCICIVCACVVLQMIFYESIESIIICEATSLLPAICYSNLYQLYAQIEQERKNSSSKALGVLCIVYSI